MEHYTEGMNAASDVEGCGEEELEADTAVDTAEEVVVHEVTGETGSWEEEDTGEEW